MSSGIQTFGSDGLGAEGRREVLRLFGPLIPVIVRSPQALTRGTGDFLELEALIDTGATDICIDIGTARRLGLNPVDRMFMHGVSGAVEAISFAGLLEIPNLQFKRVVQMLSPKEVALSPKIILGRSFLENYIVTYDGPNGVFHFFNPGLGLSAPIDDE